MSVKKNKAGREKTKDKVKKKKKAEGPKVLWWCPMAGRADRSRRAVLSSCKYWKQGSTACRGCTKPTKYNREDA